MIIFGPFTFGVLMALGYFLYALQLTDSINPPSLNTVIYVSISILMYFWGAIYGYIYFSKKIVKFSTKKIRNVAKVRNLWIIFTCCTILFAYEHLNFYVEFGSIPIFSDDYEILRFEFGKNGYVHLMASLSPASLAVIIFDYLENKLWVDRLYTWVVIIAFLVVISMIIMVGHRGVIMSLFAIIFIAMSILRRYRGVVLPIFLTVVVIYIMGYAKLVRDISFYGPSVLQTIEVDSKFGSGFGAPLYFSYLGIAMNFSMLDIYVRGVDELQYGYFTLVKPLLTPLPWFKYGLIDFQRDYLGIDFHGLLTTTFIGVPYVDFGFFGSILLFFYGLFASYLYIGAIRSNDYGMILCYSCFTWQMILGIYTYTFGELYVFIHIIFYYYVGKKISTKDGI